MLAIFLKILSILGIVLLILLCTVLVLLLLILFFPISYRIKGQKDNEAMTLYARASWLFGLLRVQYVYPEPGKPVIKILCFRLWGGKDKKDTKKEKRAAKTTKKENAKIVPAETTTGSAGTETSSETISVESSGKPEQETTPLLEQDAAPLPEQNTASFPEQEPASLPEQETPPYSEQDAAPSSEQDAAPSSEQESPLAGISKFLDRISAKYEKIKYTIKKICDRIKHIWKNITFYRELLTEKNTRELFGHACIRVGKILKGIRPRKLKADVRFGAASPDTTGYLYGLYSMLSPKLGKNITVIPDFDRAVLEGDFFAAGHITAFRILVHSILLLLDKHLRKFLRRVKMYRAAQQ